MFCLAFFREKFTPSFSRSRKTIEYSSTNFPTFGTDLTEQELALQKALHALEQTLKGKKLRLPRLAEIRKTAAVPDHARQYLERMELDRPQSVKERLLQGLVVYALASVNAI